jgi:dephospho-CoA kinase
VLRVGLTGGIGSGKSTAARLLAERGAFVVDADTLAREVVEPGTQGLAEIVVAFGPDVLDSTGALDRTALGHRVFDDAAARERLEAIIHPRVRARAAEMAGDAPADAVVVHDIPLLVETGQSDDFDVVVVVDCPADVQVRRLTEGRSMSVAEAGARIAAQASRSERLAAADVVIDNDGSLDDLRTAVDAVWEGLTQRAIRRAGPAKGES